MSMNAQPRSSGGAASPGTATPPPAPRFDRRFIEEHHLLDKYLTGKLPLKGARDLEKWCRENPLYLEELQLELRTQSALKLLEAVGKPQDLAEPEPPWWKHVYFHIGLGAVAALSLLAFMVLFAKFVLVRGELEDALAVAKHGALLPPASLSALRVEPDRAPGINRAKFTVNHAVPMMIDLKIDMGFTKLSDFKVVLEKQEQGRALIIEHLAKDSNGDLRVSFNSSALSSGAYSIRIDGLPFRGDPIGMGWLLLDVL
jgi:hypothetical protein